MGEEESFVIELVGHTVLVKTHGGLGTKDASLLLGEYKGTLLGFDGNFIRLEYEVRKFSSGATAITKEMILINLKYVVTLEEYKKDE